MQAYQVKIGALQQEVPLDALFDASFFERTPKAG